MSKAEQEIEQEIQAKDLNAPRLTPALIDNKIAYTYFHIVPKTTLTLCTLILENGFAVTGESAAASPENFDKDVGRKIAYANARDKIWPLEGYLLRERLAKKHKVFSIEIPDGVEIPASLLEEWRASFISAVEGYQLLPENDKKLIAEAHDVIFIAKICHEVNRAYCQAIGDNSQPTWEDAPLWQQNSAIAGVKFHIANPDAGTDDSHKSWLAEKEADGWKYGPVKNPELKEHPCYVPYEELPTEQKAKDYLFRAIVHSLAINSERRY